MAKIEVTPISSGYNVAALNETLQDIENEFKNKVVYRDEVAPMERALDMNGNSIINVDAVEAQSVKIGDILLTEADFSAESAAALRGDLASSDAGKGGDLVNLHTLEQFISTTTTDAIPEDRSIYGIRTTSRTADTFFADHIATGALGSGYGFHALDSGDGANGGGAIGGATERTAMADAVVGNRRGAGPGNGVIGTRWESGDGHGVYGIKRAEGTGNAVYGYKVQTGAGDAIGAINESTQGHALKAVRRNGGGPGDGVQGYAATASAGYAYTYTPLAGVKYGSVSIRGIKMAGDSGAAVLADGAGNQPALVAVSRTNAQPAAELTTTSDNTSLYSAQVIRENGAVGIALQAGISVGAGARTGAVVAARAIVNPTGASTGTSVVVAQDGTITSNVVGSVRTIAISGTNSSTGSAESVGVYGVSDGANTVNYGVYGTAANGTTNWAGYFSGKVFAGDNLTLNGGQWNGAHLIFGTVHVWVDSTTKLRIKNGAPTSDTDGTIVGTQT